MGACNFTVKSFGRTIQDAFKNAVDNALYEHGHDCYNGTISTTDFKCELKDVPRYGTKAYNKYIDDLLNDWTRLKKWETVGFKLTGKYAQAWRKNNGYSRKKGDVYVFFGWAGC